jgi:hypothetical protein
MTTVVLLNFAAALWALIARFVPKADGWWNTKATPFVKRLVMAGLVIASAFVLYGLSCLGWSQALNWTLTCDANGAQQLFGLVSAALVNQGTYNLIKDRS